MDSNKTTDELHNILRETPAPPRFRISLASLVLLAGVVIALGTIGWAFIEQNRGQPTSGPAPGFTVTTFDGEQISLEELRGQVVILNFWGSWCAPCRDEAPELERIHQLYEGQGVVLIGVTYAESSERDSINFIEEFGLTYRNAPDSRTDVADRYHIKGVPETFVIDQRGHIAEGGFFSGPVNEAVLSQLIDRLLQEESMS